MRRGENTRPLRQAATILVAALLMLLLPPLGLVHLGISPGLAGNLFWTEPEWIGAVVVFLLVLSVRAVLSSRGTWLGIFSMVLVAGLSYISVPFLSYGGGMGWRPRCSPPRCCSDSARPGWLWPLLLLTGCGLATSTTTRKSRRSRSFARVTDADIKAGPAPMTRARFDDAAVLL